MNAYDVYRSKVDAAIPAMMQAVVARGVGFENVAVAEVPVPEVGPDQLLARVDAAGVCTSILKLVAQGPEHTYVNGWNMERWPLILGDEGAVTVVKVGKNLVGRYAVGQRFAIQPSVAVPPILHRERYRNRAEGMRKCAVGYTLGGNLAQYILIQEEVLAADCLLPLPDDEMAYYEVSMAEPISCIYSAQERNYHVLKDGPHGQRRAQLGLSPGGVTVVVGAGAMGRMHAELALRFRPAVLIVSDLQQERLERTAKCIGAKAARNGTRLVCVTAEKLQAAVREASHGRGADDIILAVGARPVQQAALGLLADGGVANLFGGLPKGDHILDVDALAVHYREIKLVGSSGGDPSDMAATLRAIRSRDIDAGNYVAAVGSLDNAVEVLKMIKETRIDGKAILYPHIRPTPLRFVEHWGVEDEKTLLAERLNG
ncbi:MAG TPA: zinc-binding dehydrogenase [Anaerohalosphaeraceae bacterium]|nr:zinc-binding dehydrogenase [Anaerohalosphaeraceae bacterium]HRT49630.1 zinc-binding dehydrogenase [Anaerohalosphaeraceae bacterium]HRT85435.1 zinc-binding dehydrogenase [Anaerohalosphaeraceae bacterium]